MDEKQEGISIYESEKWIRATFACLTGIEKVLKHADAPTRETAEIVCMLADAAKKLGSY